MTVSTTARKQNYAGGQSALTFTFRALINHPEDIKVLVVSSGTETLLTYNSDYTVTISTDGIGGVVHVSPSFSTGYTYTVYRETENKQESDYDDYNQFPANTLEDDIDRRTLVSQEMEEKIGRSVVLPISSTGSGLTLPEPISGRALKWNDTGDGLENTSMDIEDAITEASNYASTASTQAGLAQASALAAAASESNAANDAASALTSKNSASSSASIAVAAATTATTASSASTQAIAAATSATLSASQAATSATLAGNYASSASSASLYATTASTAATNASNYASTASTAATSASASAISAATSATDALGTVTWNMGLADHSISGLRVSLTANATIAMGDICAINTAGTLKIAKADLIANASALVLCGSAAAAGTASTCLVNGIARDDTWNWTPGQLLYLSAAGTTGNTITATAPTGSDQVIQIIGVALTADIIYFIPSLVQVEHT